MIPIMEFSKFIFFDGLNITVRRGNKWDVFREPKTGVLKSVDPIDPDIETYCTFLASVVLRFDEIPSALLKLEHDPDCRTWVDLIHEMEKIYVDFDKNEDVTIVFFRPDPPVFDCGRKVRP